MFCNDLFHEGAEAAARLEQEVAKPGGRSAAAARAASSRAVDVLLAAAALGIFADVLLRPFPWGINFALWVGLLILAALEVAARSGYVWRRAELTMLAGIGLLGCALAWRDAPALVAVNLIGILILGAWLALPAQTPSLRGSSMGAYLGAAASTATNVVVGFVPLLVSDAPTDLLRAGPGRQRAWKIGRGILFSIPLLVFFGILFAAADERFEQLALRILDFDLEEVVSHGLVIVFFTWAAAGLLRELFVQRGGLPVAFPKVSPRLSGLEVAIPIGVVTLLFLTFVVIQARYFFGGESFVEITPGLTYAAYARRGFFELVTAASFVLPLLLLGDYLLRDEPRAQRRIDRGLAGALVALVLLVLASAWHRMHVYRAQFGWTELRLYTTVFMVWLALVFVWFVATVLRGTRARFPFVPIVAAFVVVASLNVLNPVGFIVRANAARAVDGHAFDASYAASLGADAVPALVAAWPSLEIGERCRVVEQLSSRRLAPEEHDWRTWNVSRRRAQRLINERRSEWIAMRNADCAANP